MTKNLIKFI